MLLLKEYLTVQDMLRDTVGFVLKLRDVFRMQFEAFEAGVVNSQSGVEKLFHPNFLGFSDSFVAFVALRNKDEHLTPNIRMFSTLSAACIVMLTSLASTPFEAELTLVWPQRCVRERFTAQGRNERTFWKAVKQITLGF